MKASPSTTTRKPAAKAPSKSAQARAAREAKVEAAGPLPGDGAPAPAPTGLTKADVKEAVAVARAAGKAAKAERGERAERTLKANPPQALAFDAAERYPDIAPIHVPLIQAAYKTLERGAVQAALAHAYVAGLPITIMGRLIGRSAGEARRMALAGAKTLGIDVVLRGRGNATPRAGSSGGSSVATVTYDPAVRYPGWSEVAEALDAPAAKDATVRAAIILQAMTDGFPITLIGSHVGWSASRVHTTAKAYAASSGRPFPSKEARKATRQKGTTPITQKGKAAAKAVAAKAVAAKPPVKKATRARKPVAS